MYNKPMYLCVIQNKQDTMARKIYSIEQRKKLILRAGEEFKYKSRAKKLYNYIYKHSTYYKISYSLRAASLLVSLYILNFNTLFTSVSKEIIADIKTEEFTIGKKLNNPENRDLILVTRSAAEYAIGYTLLESDVFWKNDAIEVIKNIFGKTSYIVNTKTKHRSQLSKLRRFDNFLLFVALATFLSLLVFDAYEFLYRVYIKIIFGLDIFAIAFYFLM